MMKKHFFRSRATQTETSEPLPPTRIPIGRDMLPIKARLFRLRGQKIIGAGDITYHIPELVVDAQMMVPLARLKKSYLIKRGYTKIMAGYLSKMSIPKDEQLTIIRKVFQVVEEAVPRLPITVIIVDVDVTVTNRTSEPGIELGDDQVKIDEVAWEFMETHMTAQHMRNLLCLEHYLRQWNTMALSVIRDHSGFHSEYSESES